MSSRELFLGVVSAVSASYASYSHTTMLIRPAQDTQILPYAKVYFKPGPNANLDPPVTTEPEEAEVPGTHC